MERGTISEIDVLPCLIEQILYPPEVPPSVRPILQAAINSHNEQNFILAIENFKAAKTRWREIGELKPSIELFFQYSLGSVFNSAGRDDHALQHYMSCRYYAESSKLTFANPDRALPYCGIGSILYNME